MKTSKLKWQPAIGLLAVLSFILLIEVSCKERDLIKIDGSSTVFDITEAIVEEFSDINKEARLTIGISGTGGGFKKICEGELDLSNASRRIKADEEKKCEENGVILLEFPIAADGITVVTNKENDFFIQATIDELKAIYQSGEPTLKKWSQVRAGLPDDEMKIYSPGHDSGTFDYFQSAIIGKQNEIRGNISFSEDDNFLVKGVSDDKYAIAFLGITYYLQNQDSLNAVAIVNPKTNRAYLPNVETVSQNKYSPLSRYLYIYVNVSSLEERENLANFIRFYLQNAERLSAAVGAVPLPQQKYTENLEVFAQKY